jgi:DNA polymerase-3 subunit alpha
VFELFIFSDTLELNREILKEGSSLLLTLVKTISNDENKTKRINVQKIASLKDLINKPISEVLFKITSPNQLEKISNLLAENGKTKVNIELDNGENKMTFKLVNPRNLDRKTLNLIKNQQIQAEIN